MVPVTEAEFLAARSALVEKIGAEAAQRMLGGTLAEQIEIIHQMQERAEELAGLLEKAKGDLAMLRSKLGAGSLQSARAWLEDQEIVCQSLRRELQGLANIAAGSGLFPLTDRVQAALS